MSPLESTIITMKNTIIGKKKKSRKQFRYRFSFTEVRTFAEKLMKTEPEAPEVVRRAKHFFVSCLHESKEENRNVIPQRL